MSGNPYYYYNDPSLYAGQAYPSYAMQTSNPSTQYYYNDPTLYSAYSAQNFPSYTLPATSPPPTPVLSQDAIRKVVLQHPKAQKKDNTQAWIIGGLTALGVGAIAIWQRKALSQVWENVFKHEKSPSVNSTKQFKETIEETLEEQIPNEPTKPRASGSSGSSAGSSKFNPEPPPEPTRTPKPTSKPEPAPVPPPPKSEPQPATSSTSSPPDPPPQPTRTPEPPSKPEPPPEPSPEPEPEPESAPPPPPPKPNPNPEPPPPPDRSKPTTEPTPEPAAKVTPNVKPPQEVQKFLDDYNNALKNNTLRDWESTQEGINTIMQTEDSLNDRRLGWQNLFTEEKKRGYYCRTSDGFVVPSQYFRLNGNNLNTFVAFFKVDDESKLLETGKFILVKPAKVDSSGKLTEKGDVKWTG